MQSLCGETPEPGTQSMPVTAPTLMVRERVQLHFGAVSDRVLVNGKCQVAAWHGKGALREAGAGSWTSTSSTLVQRAWICTVFFISTTLEVSVSFTTGIWHISPSTSLHVLKIVLNMIYTTQIVRLDGITFPANVHSCPLLLTTTIQDSHWLPLWTISRYRNWPS